MGFVCLGDSHAGLMACVDEIHESLKVCQPIGRCEFQILPDEREVYVRLVESDDSLNALRQCSVLSFCGGQIPSASKL